MTFSKLCSGYLLSPNFSSRLGERVCKITPHHASGRLSAKRLCEIFAAESRKASANYCIGNDGEIWGCVPEEYRAWTSSSAWNDRQAITIEISNDINEWPWSISDKAWESFKLLTLDICLRYNITPEWEDNNKHKSITYHRYYAATTCPGPWAEEHMPQALEDIRMTIDDVKKMADEIKKLDAILKNYDQRLDALETIVAGYVLPKYKTLKDIENDPRASWAYPYVVWAIDNKVIYGISEDNLGLSYNDLRLLAYIKRGLDTK